MLNSILADQPRGQCSRSRRITTQYIRVKVNTSRPADRARHRIDLHRREHRVIIDHGEEADKTRRKVQLSHQPIGKANTQNPALHDVHIDNPRQVNDIAQSSSTVRSV